MSRHLQRPRLLIVVGIAVALLVTACGGTANDSRAAGSGAEGESRFAGYQLEPAADVGAISLPAVNRANDSFAFQAEPDSLLLTTFGFTNCPDICPTTLADIRLAFTNLGPRADEVDLAWISIDPERDTAEATQTYVEAFIDKGVALRTDDEAELENAKDAFGVTALFQENDDGDIEVAHTANIYVIDDEGSIVLTWPFGISSPDMVSDLNILLDDLEQQT